MRVDWMFMGAACTALVVFVAHEYAKQSAANAGTLNLVPQINPVQKRPAVLLMVPNAPKTRGGFQWDSSGDSGNG